MKRTLLFVALGLLSGFALAQDQPSTAPATSIEGAVVAEPGSQPLKRVLLVFINENEKQGGSYTTTTDSDGHFLIENVQPGRYRLYMEKPALPK